MAVLRLSFSMMKFCCLDRRTRPFSIFFIRAWISSRLTPPPHSLCWPGLVTDALFLLAFKNRLKFINIPMRGFYFMVFEVKIRSKNNYTIWKVMKKTRPENCVFSCAIWGHLAIWKDVMEQGHPRDWSKQKKREKGQWPYLLSALLDAACFSTARILAASKMDVSSAIWSLIWSPSPTLDMLSSSKASGKSLLAYLIK